MRTVVLRVLAGLLAVLWVWGLTASDLSARPLRELVGFWAVGLAFAAFALFGTEPAERLLCLVFGINYPKRPPAERAIEDDKHSEHRRAGPLPHAGSAERNSAGG